MSKRSILILVGIAFLTTAIVMPLISKRPASAYTASGLCTIFKGDDMFKNYDFKSKSATASNVDWPVTMIFYENASVNKVKDAYIYWLGWDNPFKSKMNAYVNDGAQGSGWIWDQDSGVKTWGNSTAHMRIYADQNDKLYNDSWGYYVLGTTHYDRYETTYWKKFGWNEDAEAEACAAARRYPGWSVQEDCVFLYNYEQFRQEGHDYPQSNGWASKVRVP